MAQVNAKSAYHAMNGAKISSGRQEQPSGNIQYGRTQSYGLAVELENTGSSAVCHENLYNGKIRQSHGALSRPNIQVGLRKYYNYDQYIQSSNNKPTPKSAQCIYCIEFYLHA